MHKYIYIPCIKVYVAYKIHCIFYYITHIEHCYILYIIQCITKTSYDLGYHGNY